MTGRCFSLSVGLEQDLMFELLAVTQLQVEDEAGDALQLLTQILHLQLSNLGMNEHHELPRAAKERKRKDVDSQTHDLTLQPGVKVDFFILSQFVMTVQYL